jgi:hypothetical protein
MEPAERDGVDDTVDDVRDASRKLHMAIDSWLIIVLAIWVVVKCCFLLMFCRASPFIAEASLV